jgi:hypothetical protein
MNRFNLMFVAATLIVANLAHANLNLKCVNESSSSLAFNMALNPGRAILEISPESNDGYASSLKGLTLKLVSEGSYRSDYLKFNAVVPLSSASEFQFVELSVKKSDLSNPQLEALRVKLSVSGKNYSQYSFAGVTSTQYGMICR